MFFKQVMNDRDANIFHKYKLIKYNKICSIVSSNCSLQNWSDLLKTVDILSIIPFFHYTVPFQNWSADKKTRTFLQSSKNLFNP